jgi:serine/threonine protein kinase
LETSAVWKVVVFEYRVMKTNFVTPLQVLHGDLAARNILLADDNIVKICDFGLSKTVYKYKDYKKKGEVSE